LTAGQIARRTHTPVRRVKATTSVARSELAAAVLNRHDIPLDQVAVIAEFDDGTEKGVEAVKAVTIAAQTEPARFDHVAQRLPDQREEQRLGAERVAELTAAGVRVLTEADWASPISGLRPSAEDPNGTKPTPEAHRDCPGHAAWVAGQQRAGHGDGVDGAVEGSVAAALSRCRTVRPLLACSGLVQARAASLRQCPGWEKDTMAWVALTGPMPRRSVRPTP
jgi:hypothetical protein